MGANLATRLKHGYAHACLGVTSEKTLFFASACQLFSSLTYMQKCKEDKLQFVASCSCCVISVK